MAYSTNQPVPKTDLKPMDDTLFQAVVASAIEDAENFIDEYIAPGREDATNYYYAKPLGNEIAGRSSIVMSETRDVVHSIVPGLMRVFCGNEHVVEFMPSEKEDIEPAEQATDYIDFIFMKDNPGFQNIYNVALDGLIRKTGIFKWWWEKKVEITEETYEGQTPAGAAMLLGDKTVEVLEQTVNEPEEEGGESTVTLRVRHTRDKGRERVTSIPPEEFIISRDASDEDAAVLIGHRRLIRVSDLVAMGYDRDEVLAAADYGPDLGTDNTEAQTRNPAITDDSQPDEDPALRLVKYFDVLMLIDKDGDGIAERRNICAIGDNKKVMHDEIVPDVNYAMFCPSPEPHTAIGQSIADETMDLQKIKSNLMRFTLDGMAQSIIPRTAVNERVNMDDANSNEIGQNIRVKGPVSDSILPITQPFDTGGALSMLAYMDEVKSSRTGISKASQGLDPDALQSTTATAVNATVSAAEMRQEVIARFMGETLKRVFRGILRDVRRHQDVKRTIRLRNEFVEVDPRAWNADMDVSVNVAVGSARRTEKYLALGQIASKQEAIITKLGPDNILCDVSQLRNTYAKMIELTGEKDPSMFFKEVNPEQLQQMAQQAQQGGQQDDGGVGAAIAKAEVTKAEADMLMAQQKPKIEAAKAQSQDDRERDKVESDVYLRSLDMALKYGLGPDAGMQMAMQALTLMRQQRGMGVPPMQAPGQGQVLQ